MRRAILISCISLLVCAYWACKNNSSNPTNSNNNTSASSAYLPLAVGNWWVYANYDTDSNAVKVPGSEKTEYDTIVGTTTVQGRQAYIMHTLIDTTHSIGYLAYDTDGNLLSFIDTSSGKGKGFWITLAEFSDSTYGRSVTYYTTLTYGGIPLTDTTMQTYYGVTSVGVPAGLFPARNYTDTVYASINYLFATGTVSGSDKTYYAPGVGRVKEESANVAKSTFLNQNGGTHAELVLFHVQ